MGEKKVYTTKEITFICELIWGGVPVDRNWAVDSELFKNKAPEILAKYPMLDKSLLKK